MKKMLILFNVIVLFAIAGSASAGSVGNQSYIVYKINYSTGHTSYSRLSFPNGESIGTRVKYYMMTLEYYKYVDYVYLSARGTKDASLKKFTVAPGIRSSETCDFTKNVTSDPNYNYWSCKHWDVDPDGKEYPAVKYWWGKITMQYRYDSGKEWTRIYCVGPWC